MYAVVSALAVAHDMTIRFQDYQARYKKDMGEFHAQSEESSFVRAPTASATDLDSLETPTLKEAPSFISKTESQFELVEDETRMFHPHRAFSTSHHLLMSSRQ
jgi:hypothetical protein